MNKKTVMKKVAAISAVLLTVSSVLTLCGCPRAVVERREQEELEAALRATAVKFTDSTLESVFAELFETKTGMVQPEQLASVTAVDIMTYSDDNSFSIAGISADGTEYTATADITGKVFGNMEDFKYLTELRRLSTIYTGFESYDFIADCKKLEIFESTYNHECDDYSALAELPELKTVMLDGATVSDMSVFGQLTQIEELTLRSITKASGLNADAEDYDPLFDISFVSGLTNLTSLEISQSNVYDITPLAGLTNLRTLNLGYNKIEDLTPISGLTSLVNIDLTQNNIDDVSMLTNYDAENFERIVFDHDKSIGDWSPLDYLGDKVQHPDIIIESPTLASAFGYENGWLYKGDLESVHSVAIDRDGDKYMVSLGIDGKDFVNVELAESLEAFSEHFYAFIYLENFATKGVEYSDYDFLYKCDDSLLTFIVEENGVQADYSILAKCEKLMLVKVTDSVISDRAFFESLEVSELILD